MIALFSPQDSSIVDPGRPPSVISRLPQNRYCFDREQVGTTTPFHGRFVDIRLLSLLRSRQCRGFGVSDTRFLACYSLMSDSMDGSWNLSNSTAYSKILEDSSGAYNVAFPTFDMIATYCFRYWRPVLRQLRLMGGHRGTATVVSLPSPPVSEVREPL